MFIVFYGDVGCGCYVVNLWWELYDVGCILYIIEIVFYGIVKKFFNNSFEYI